MKACTKCNKDIPDSAMHCVFCGEKQSAAAGTAKTMMGYAGMAQDVLAAAKAEREKQLAEEAAAKAAAQPAPSAPQPAPQAAQPAPSAPQPAPRAAQPAPSAPQRAPSQDPYGTTQPVDPLPARGAAPAAAPPAQQGYPPPGQPQGYPPPGQPQGYPPPGQPQGYPPPAQPQGYPPPGQPQGYPPPGQPQGYPPPGQPQGYPPPGAPPQAQHPYPPHQRPPYLASETGTRMNAPVEPWADSLKRICTVFGALLLVAFVAPWAVVGSKMAFSWDMLDAGDTATKVIPILIAVSGLGALILGLAPVSVSARGIGAALVGLGPLIFMAVGSFAMFSQGGRGGAAASFEWRLFALLISLMALATGFLLRSQYRSAALARILCTVAGALILVVYVVPENNRTLVGDMIDTMTKAPLIEAKLFAVYMLLPMLLAVIGFASWAPATTGMGARLWAWLSLLWAPVLIIGMFVIALGSARGDIGDNILAMLMLVYHIPIAILAWYALSSYGLSTLLGKQLEHR